MGTVNNCNTVITVTVTVNKTKKMYSAKLKGRRTIMSKYRMISRDSEIYHRKDCHYAKRIKYKGFSSITPKEAKSHGYRPCKCCNTMNHIYKSAKGTLRQYEKKKGMKFNYSRSSLYVLTDNSCWKLVYSRKEETIILYHRNKSWIPVNFEEPYKEKYHLQVDAKHFNNIEGALYYIYEHDRFRTAQERGDRSFVYISKKYERQAKKKKKRDAVNRVNYLFRMLESQDKDLIQYSFC